MERIGEAEGWLRIGGTLLRGTLPPGMEPGRRLLLEVVSAGPPPVLRAASESAAPASLPVRAPADGLIASLRLLLSAGPPGDADPGSPLAAVRQLLSLPRPPAELSAALGRWVKANGVFHEFFLARGEDPSDLKALLLRVLARLPPEAGAARGAEAFLSHIQAHQVRSVLEGVPILPFVLPWGEQWVQGELRLEESAGQEGTDRRRGSLVLRLELPRLGTVEARLRWGEAGVSARLTAAPAAAAELAGCLPELRKELTGRAGVRLLDLRAEPRETPPPPDRSLLQVLA